MASWVTGDPAGHPDYSPSVVSMHCSPHWIGNGLTIRRGIDSLDSFFGTFVHPRRAELTFLVRRLRMYAIDAGVIDDSSTRLNTAIRFDDLTPAMCEAMSIQVSIPYGEN